MDDKVWIATIAALALGIGVALLVIYLKNNSENVAVSYKYDADGRLQGIVPMKQPIELRPV